MVPTAPVQEPHARALMGRAHHRKNRLEPEAPAEPARPAVRRRRHRRADREVRHAKSPGPGGPGNGVPAGTALPAARTGVHRQAVEAPVRLLRQRRVGRSDPLQPRPCGELHQLATGIERCFRQRWTSRTTKSRSTDRPPCSSSGMNRQHAPQDRSRDRGRTQRT